MRTKKPTEFLLGVLWSAWFVSSAHGYDSFAEEMLLEVSGVGGVAEMQRLARYHEYHFRRGFWAELKRHEGRIRSHRAAVCGG